MKTLLVAAGAAFVLATTTMSVASAPPLSDFTVDADPVSLLVLRPLRLVADKFTGNYNQVLAVHPDFTFSAEAYWDGGQLVHDDGAIPYSARRSRLGVDYAVYALLSYSGTLNPIDGEIAATGGSFTLYLDRAANTGKTLPDSAPSPVALSGSRDDSVLGTATLISGEGLLRFGNVGGDFGLIFASFTLTPLGRQYFVAPNPFHTFVALKGHVNSIDIPIGAQRMNGAADLVTFP